MKIPQCLKRPAGVIIALVMTLSLLLPPAAIVSAQSGGTALPDLKIENFKWQDVLDSSIWTVNPDSGVDLYQPGVLFEGSHTAVQRPLQNLHILFDSAFARNGFGASIVLSLDSQAIQATYASVTDLYMQEIATFKKSPTFKLWHEEGSTNSGRWMYVFSGVSGLSFGRYLVRLPNAVIMIGTPYAFQFDEKTLVAMLRGLEAKAEELIGGPSIQLVHYHPFGREDPAHKAGDIVATVTKNGNPVFGQRVYLFLNLQKSDMIFEKCFSYITPSFYPKYSGSLAAIIGKEGVYSDGYMNYLSTDQKGQVTYNYFVDGSLDVNKLALEMGPHHMTAAGVVTAVVFDNDPVDYILNGMEGPVPQIMASADVTLNFNYTARITNIITRNKLAKPEPSVEVDATGYDDEVVDMSKVGNLASPTHPAPELWGFPLFYGDWIVIGPYDEVIVQWLNGVKLGFRARGDWASSGRTVAEVWIGTTDSGLLDRIYRTAVSTRVAIVLGLSSLFTGTAGLCVTLSWPVTSWWAGLASAAATGLGVLCTAWVIGAEEWSPLIVEAQSQILFDFGNSTTLQTLEGKATVYSAGHQSKVDVTTGHSMQIAPDGTFGKVTTFKQSDLSPDSISLVNDMQNSESLVAATPAGGKTPAGNLAPSGQLSDVGSGSNSKMGEYLSIVAVVAAIVVLTLTIGFIRRRRGKAALKK